jgi:hypothetical protein
MSSNWFELRFAGVQKIVANRLFFINRSVLEPYMRFLKRKYATSFHAIVRTYRRQLNYSCDVRVFSEWNR